MSADWVALSKAEIFPSVQRIQGWRHMVDVVGGTEPSSASEQRRRAVLVLLAVAETLLFNNVRTISVLRRHREWGAVLAKQLQQSMLR